MLTLARRLLLCCALLPCSVVGADEVGRHWYRYFDDQQQPVLSDTLSAAALRHGYQVLDANMNVIKDVAPPPDAAELARRQQLAEQQKADARLLSLYGSSSDARRQMQSRLEALQANIDIKQGALQRAQSEREQDTRHAADFERSGKAVPAGLLKHIAEEDQGIRSLQSDIAHLRTSMDSTRNDYSKVIARLQSLEMHQTSNAPNSSPNPASSP